MFLFNLQLTITMYQFILKWFLIQSKLQHQQQILNYNLVIEVVEITFDCKFLTSSSLCEWKNACVQQRKPYKIS